MAVGGISGGGSDVWASAIAAQAAAAEAATSMLRDALDTALEQNAQLMQALPSANPPGVGGSVDTYG